ncbi:ionotropic receptor 21a-like [Penaeus chinensis]|uniref:ionotropic receptor 21a-like n=1 Tax=Penaeus chinensis TaxID=139456 RepID=UPI001FB7A83B|nr:ionotropic receptor 21a-like [Penaeus chinensis]
MGTATRILLGTIIFLRLLLIHANPPSPATRLTNPSTSLHLQTLQELLHGPLYGWKTVLYFDPSLGVEVLDRLFKLLAFRTSGHVLVNLEHDGAQWSQNQTSAVLRGGHMVHVVVFQEDFRPFFDSVSLQWNPKYLLLFPFSKIDVRKVLQYEGFKGPGKSVLLGSNEKTNKMKARHIKVYTYFPFAREKPIRLLGLWNPETFPSFESIFVDRFPSFEGYNFWLGTWFDDYPYLHQSKTGPEGEGDGVEVEMLDAMARRLNYTYHLTIEPPDLNWGDFENGSWTGMLGMVHSKDKNFTVNYFGYTNERIEAFDHSVSYWNEGFGLALLRPPPLPKWRSVYYPFTFEVWASVSATFVLTVIVMLIQDMLQPKPFLGGVGSTWPFLLRAMFNNSIPRLPKAQWQRLFVGSWWLYCFIVTTAYTANLIAFLTIPVFPARIQTVQQLAESDYRYDPEATCLETGVSMYDYGEFVPGALRTSKDPHYRTLGERLDLYSTDDESMYPVLNGTHAYIESYSYSVVYIFDRYKVKNAYMLREQLYPGHLCWYFQKNTAWKYKFDEAIQRLVESGLIEYWLKIKTEDFLGTDYERKEKLSAEERTNTALSLEHVQGVFFLLLIGWAVSFLTFLAEFLTKSARRQQSDVSWDMTD